MVDERIASEVTANPGGASAEALNREYGGPAVTHPGSPVSMPAMAQSLPSTAGMTPEQAAAEHSRCMASPAFMAQLNNAGGKKAALAHLEALSAARFGNGAAASQKPAGAPLVGEDGKPLSVEQQRAHEALGAHAAELASPEELRYLDEAAAPKVGGEFHALAHAEDKNFLLQLGAHPGTVNYLVSQEADYRTWRDNSVRFDAAVRTAGEIIAKRPDAQQIFADADAYLDIVEKGTNGRLMEGAWMACCYPAGILELARHGRRARTAGR
jgi:hypothetical protein